MFFVIIYSAIDQGYIGLSLASCHKDEIWDLRAELGLIWDHFKALAPIGTKSQIWDLVTSTANGKSFLEPFFKKNYSPNQSNAEWPEREATKALIDVTTSCL